MHEARQPFCDLICGVVCVVHQCWCGEDRGLHHSEYRVGEDEVRRGGGPVPDRQDVTHPETCHGADRGMDEYTVLLLSSVVGEWNGGKCFSTTNQKAT